VSISHSRILTCTVKLSRTFRRQHFQATEIKSAENKCLLFSTKLQKLPVIFISKIFVTAYSTYLVGKKLLYENLFIDADSLMNHGKFYYVTVTAINSVELQSYAFSGPIAIDTTPPKAAKVINLHTTYRMDVTNNTATMLMNSKTCITDEGNLLMNYCYIYINKMKTAFVIQIVHFYSPIQVFISYSQTLTCAILGFRILSRFYIRISVIIKMKNNNNNDV
jgi:hypothetical protein